MRGYYFPWGTKHIPYADIKSVRRVQLSAARGKGRIWGTSNPRYWAHLDPRRPRKSVGLILDLGRWVRPLLTPDDADAVEAAIRAHTTLTPSTEGGRGPII
ncbi:PH domain-containing protein [Skermania sp. ID1734]|uniref:PH domain-containing protein n=1 Tax=Skermania sp. ID1734 TaxID=2597516 RepID=UPI001C8F35C7|nr:PH domain-containing protein [Skermania sp. ID1734]